MNILAALSMLAGDPNPEGTTAFSRLSQEAQDLIVGATMGEFESGPPPMSEEVREEIRIWAELDEGLG